MTRRAATIDRHPSGFFVAGALAVALGALALFAAGVASHPERAAFAYLAAHGYALSLAVGSLFWLMIQHAIGATWFVALRRLAEDLTGSLPLLAALFAPVLLMLPILYPWARSATELEPHVRSLIAHKRAYLNVEGFAVRSAIYFVAWIVMAQVLRRWSLRQNAETGHKLVRWQRRLSAGGLAVLAFTLHFSAVDWWMSLEPTWSSSMFGVYAFAGSATAAIALLTLVSIGIEGRLRPDLRMGVSHYHALGKLLFTLVVFWAYAAYFQFMLIWSANVPEEVAWYAPRWQGAWRPLGWLLILGHFGVPFVALLSRALRRSRRGLALLSSWLLVMHAADVYWIVMPAHSPHGAAPHWLDAMAFIGLGALAVAAIAGGARRDPLIAEGDPRWRRSLRFVSH